MGSTPTYRAMRTKPTKLTIARITCRSGEAEGVEIEGSTSDVTTVFEGVDVQGGVADRELRQRPASPHPGPNAEDPPGGPRGIVDY